MPSPDTMTVPEVAELLGMSRWTLYQIHRGAGICTDCLAGCILAMGATIAGMDDGAARLRERTEIGEDGSCPTPG